MRIVDGLKRSGEVVAMTGDGVDAAPALKPADVGVAMGVAGSDVTRETADMVRADDTCVRIVSAVEQGRIISSNIRKFVFHLQAWSSPAPRAAPVRRGRGLHPSGVFRALAGFHHPS